MINFYIKKCDSSIIDVKEKKHIVYRIRRGAPRSERDRWDTNQRISQCNAFFISADNIYPEPELIDQDQNKRKLDTDIFFLCCDFRILFLITADALYQDGDEDQSDQIVLFYFLPKCS